MVKNTLGLVNLLEANSKKYMNYLTDQHERYMPCNDHLVSVQLPMTKKESLSPKFSSKDWLGCNFVNLTEGDL